MRQQSAARSDAEIVDLVRGGEVDAFETLVERYENRVFGIVARHVPRDDAEEVAHEAFVRAYLSLSSFAGTGDFAGWLSRIASRACSDYWRERYRRRERSDSALGDEERRWMDEAAAGRSIALLEREESVRHASELLERALARLSPEDRMVIEIVHIEERPVKEAAAALGWSAANVKVRAFRARRRLRRILGEMLEDRRGRS
jgi:RNA polymerase sigma-70 factor (ECF subfamily)